jgi:hypothetical protein
LRWMLSVYVVHAGAQAAQTAAAACDLLLCNGRAASTSYHCPCMMLDAQHVVHAFLQATQAAAAAAVASC